MSYLVLGVMSGTSLDGIDLALCNFELHREAWAFQIVAAETFGYSEEWYNRLENAHRFTAFDFIQLHNQYGRFTGQLINRFLDGRPKPQLIASHGHTIFHQPEKKLTFQLGNGSVIAAETGIDTVFDFRNLDVALGGQGAPLVPMGDRLLFANYDYCLNLGGFANISFENEGKRLAWDISPVNIVLNYYARKAGLQFDLDGNLGSAGQINDLLLNKLNQLDYYQQTHPKSLGREWIETVMLPLIESHSLSLNDVLATLYEHIGTQIGMTLSGEKRQVLVTGGGAKNSFLLRKISKYAECKLIVPDDLIVDFKEALIFAFLGLLCYNGIPTALSSVTGASCDNISGTLVRFKPDKCH